jgi:hypothetical protein
MISMWLRSQTHKEKAQGKRIMRWAGIAAGVLLGILLLIGFPSNLWTPNGAGDFLRGLLCAVLFAAAGVFLLGATPLIEDWEVRKHKGPGPIINPLAASIPLYGFAGVVACVVFIIRYAYLLFFR